MAMARIIRSFSCTFFPIICAGLHMHMLTEDGNMHARTMMSFETGASGQVIAIESEDYAVRSGLELIKYSGRLKSPKNAIVTHICDSNWAPGALALGASLRKYNPQAEVVVMITPEVSGEYHDLLADVFDRVYIESPILPHPSITRSGADCITLQIRSWTLPYEKALYMDSDMIMLSNPDPLFELYGELSAKQDDLKQYGFSGGMFVLEPNQAVYEKLANAVKKYPRVKSNDPTMHGIQQFLNHMYPSCSDRHLNHTTAAGCWGQSLDPTLNICTRDLSKARVREILAGNSTMVKSLHFSGDWGDKKKPWMSGCMQASDSITHSGARQLHLDILTLWVHEFRRVKARPGSEHLLELACPVDVGLKLF